MPRLSTKNYNRWWIYINNNGSVIVKKIGSSDSDKTYDVKIDKTNNCISCNCLGFIRHGRCKHIRFYKSFIESVLYPIDKIAEGLLTNFKSIKKKVKYTLLEKPEILEENKYHTLFGSVFTFFPETIGKETTIERAYRWLKANDKEITALILVDTEIKTEKQEKIMHEINLWEAKSFIAFTNPQSQLIPDDLGVEK